MNAIAIQMISTLSIGCFHQTRLAGGRMALMATSAEPSQGG
jgi:hypothetical protein